MRYAVGVDIGGTSIKAGLVNERGETVLSAKILSKGAVDEVFFCLGKSISDMLSKQKLSLEKITGIGIACPGGIDPETGYIEFFPNLDWRGFSVKEKMLAALAPGHSVRDVRICNDADAAALAENMFGEGKKYQNFVFLTIGTGIGGSLILGGRPYRGNGGRGIEIGHMIVREGGENCGCGMCGCFEAYASGKALLKNARNILQNSGGNPEALTGISDVFSGYGAGSAPAVRAVNEFAENIGLGIININNMLRPEAVIIGGGLSHYADIYLPIVKKYCAERDYGYKNSPVPFLIASPLLNEGGVIGAAAQCF